MTFSKNRKPDERSKYSRNFYRARRRRRLYHLLMFLVMLVYLFMLSVMMRYQLNFLFGNVLFALITTINFAGLFIKMYYVDREDVFDSHGIRIWWLCNLKLGGKKKQRAKKILKMLKQQLVETNHPSVVNTNTKPSTAHQSKPGSIQRKLINSYVQRQYQIPTKHATAIDLFKISQISGLSDWRQKFKTKEEFQDHLVARVVGQHLRSIEDSLGNYDSLQSDITQPHFHSVQKHVPRLQSMDRNEFQNQKLAECDIEFETQNSN